LSLAWGLGILLSSGILLPFLEYVSSGARVTSRTAGSEERPPVGADALPQVLVPDIYGRAGFYRLTFENQLESSAAAFAGVSATLVLTPIAFLNRWRRPQALLMAALAFIGLIWCVKLYPFVLLLRLPSLKLMSHNRLVFL